jgi:hypothetical protein
VMHGVISWWLLLATVGGEVRNPQLL